MVRFSCFNAHIHCHKPKKAVQPSAEALYKTSQDCFQSQASRESPNPTSLNPSSLKMQGDPQIESTNHVMNLSSVDSDLKSEDMRRKFVIEGEIGVNQRGYLKKSRSLGSRLFQEGRMSENATEDETDLGFMCGGSHDQKALVVPSPSKDRGVSPSDRYQESPSLEPFQLSSDIVNNESIFSIGDPPHSEKEGHENSDTPLSGECAGDFGDRTPRIPPLIEKSCSLPNIGASTPTSVKCSPFRHLALQSRSFEELHILERRQKERFIHESERRVMREQVRNDDKAEKNHFENSVDDGCDLYNYSGLAKDWIMPATDEVNPVKNFQGESSVHRWDEVPSKDFKIKRIEEWVNDLQICSPLEETNESTQSDYQVNRDSNILNSLTAPKVDGKVTPGMEAAKKYISSLSAMTTTAQLANHGLVVIPFLSAFVSLKVLNLSGNAIVRITAGALPRGLHMLNLSKNNIPTIEGLRELTRLRVLDLSYNRIFRIGHGLASCSSLKELYLAGNKISEVEGLHRLLKLNVLDLRFNKISTTKCLGQLAANYNSLQAISLEGNSAQKNVGDEQLKKYLQGLLPHLTYFNRLPIKASTLKDAADRSVRLGISSHQFDRGLRSDHKATRKVGLASHRPSSSSTHGRKGQAVVSPKRSKSRLGLLPPMGTKATTHNRQHHFDFSSKLLNFGPDLSMRRSRSEGTLGAL
ncbi:dynein regulatory complex subunit 3 [Fagus crenata]